MTLQTRMAQRPLGSSVGTQELETVAQIPTSEAVMPTNDSPMRKMRCFTDTFNCCLRR